MMDTGPQSPSNSLHNKRHDSTPCNVQRITSIGRMKVPSLVTTRRHTHYPHATKLHYALLLKFFFWPFRMPMRGQKATVPSILVLIYLCICGGVLFGIFFSRRGCDTVVVFQNLQATLLGQLFCDKAPFNNDVLVGLFGQGRALIKGAFEVQTANYDASLCACLP